MNSRSKEESAVICHIFLASAKQQVEHTYLSYRYIFVVFWGSFHLLLFSFYKTKTQSEKLIQMKNKLKQIYIKNTDGCLVAVLIWIIFWFGLLFCFYLVMNGDSKSMEALPVQSTEFFLLLILNLLVCFDPNNPLTFHTPRLLPPSIFSEKN